MRLHLSKRGGLGALLLLATLFNACIPSLQPLYTEKDLLVDEALVGSFAEEKDGAAVWTFSKGDARNYRLMIKDGDKRSPLSANLFKVAGDLYIDLFPEDEGWDDWKREDFFKSTIVPAHIFFKVSEISPVLKLHALQEEWLKEYLAKNKKAVPHTIIEKDRVVFTGSTEEMQSFLKKIRSEKDAWGEPSDFKKRSRPTAN